MKLYANRISLTLIICFLTQAIFAFNTNSAYIPLYSQKTEIMIKDGEPMTRTKYEIVFKFNDEKAITLYHNYAIYYSYFDEIEHIEAYTKIRQAMENLKPSMSKILNHIAVAVEMYFMMIKKKSILIF